MKKLLLITMILLIAGCGVQSKLYKVHVSNNVTVQSGINIQLEAPITMEIYPASPHKPYCAAEIDVMSPEANECIFPLIMKMKQFNKLLLKTIKPIVPIDTNSKKTLTIKVDRMQQKKYYITDEKVRVYVLYTVTTSEGYSKSFRVDAFSRHTFHYAVGNTVPLLLENALADDNIRLFLEGK